jgi:gamma-glutamyl-gamma-aminobutyrate hydrolase PuuD
MSSRKPLIAIAPDVLAEDGRVRISLDVRYEQAVRRAGGRPYILPPVRSRDEAHVMLAAADGLMLTGGADIDPRRYGAPRHPRTTLVNPQRERSDLLLLAEAERVGMPVLAICFGCQLVNVARGGTLIQHLADRPEVNDAHRAGNGRHAVLIKKGSPLRDVIGRPRWLNSSHHQAVDKVGRGLRVVAEADDGVVEALDDPSRPFFWAVQWHPERMLDRPGQRRLFGAFVAACR